MPAKIKFQSFTQNTDSSENTRTTIVYYGTKAECEAEADSAARGSQYGELEDRELRQLNDTQWEISLQFSNRDQNVNVTTGAPDTSYGRYSASVNSSMLSLPLSKAAKYRANWNHYLIGKTTMENGVATPPAVPAWWETATELSAAGEDFRWVESLSAMPDGKDDDGNYWVPLKDPVKPGVTSYDVPVYTITESVRFRTEGQAGDYVTGVLNKIVNPQNDFGLTSGGFNFKCDAATVGWTGRYWLATLTYTRSGDNKGWDADLYD